MRLTLILGAAAAAFFFAAPVQQAKAEFCVNQDDVGMQCGYRTIQQCEQARDGIGGFCEPNLMAKPNGNSGQSRAAAMRKPRATR